MWSGMNAIQDEFVKLTNEQSSGEAAAEQTAGKADQRLDYIASVQLKHYARWYSDVSPLNSTRFNCPFSPG